MQSWFVWVLIFAVPAMAALMVRQLISGGAKSSRDPWPGGEVPVSGDASGTRTSDCSSSTGADGGHLWQLTLLVYVLFDANRATR
jgi:hypothetical protein